MRRYFIVFLFLLPAALHALSLDQARKYFAYRKGSFEVKIKGEYISQAYGFRRIHLSYKGEGGKDVPAYLYLPTKKKPPYPCIFFMHFHVSDKSLAELPAMQWSRKGFCLFAIDGVYRGERKVEGKDILADDPRETVENMRRQIIDILRGLDYLASRKDIDRKRIGFFGISMGALTGAVATALSDVPSVIVLADAGGDLPSFFLNSEYGDVKKIMSYIQQHELSLSLEELKELVAFVDPLEYVDFYNGRPVLMLNGKKDKIVPVPNIKKLFQALGEPKKIIWYESGHVLPLTKALFDAGRFFKEQFNAISH